MSASGDHRLRFYFILPRSHWYLRWLLHSRYTPLFPCFLNCFPVPLKSLHLPPAQPWAKFESDRYLGTRAVVKISELNAYMAPLPTTIMLLGCCSNDMASRYLLFFPSIGRLGNWREQAPVAMTIYLPSTNCVFHQRRLLQFCPFAFSLPYPMITSILFFLIRNCTPLLIYRLHRGA